MSARDGGSPRRAAPPPGAASGPLRPPTDPDPVTPAGVGAEAWLAGLGVAGISRRRVALAVALALVVWIGLAFGRQLAAAGDAQARADALAAEVSRRAAEVAALEAELERIQEPSYVRQQARAYGLGAPDEIPFAIDPNAPPLATDAPGSAATRLGEAVERPSPLEVWLTILFGPDPAG